MKFWILFFTILFAATAVTIAQTQEAPPDVPVSDNNQVIYSEVIELPEVDKDELDKRFSKWKNKYFANPSRVFTDIEKNDDEIKMDGKDAFNLYTIDDKGLKQRAGKISYDIKLDIKDGKYRYVIDDIFLHRSPKIYAIKWLNENDPNKEQNYYYLQQVHDHLTELTESLKEAMEASPGGTDDDGW